MDYGTIYALSTVEGKSGVAVFRVSGANSLSTLRSFGYTGKVVPRKMSFMKLLDDNKAIIDNILFVFFDRENSFTGEDVLELHIHGSIAVIQKIYSLLAKKEGIRIALPGEFARRAFLNNKMTLSEAEGIASLIEAETEIERKVSIMQMEGSIHSLYCKWREKLLQIAASVEALIDFPDDDLPKSLIISLSEQVSAVRSEMKEHLELNKGYCESLSRGFAIAILGKPNVGKSTLLNAILNEDIAIVSDIPGTTRDQIRQKISLAGYPVMFVDTAGIRDTNDKIEELGIKKALEISSSSIINVVVMDASSKIEKKLLADVDKTIVLLNKTDTVSDKEVRLKLEALVGYKVICTSLVGDNRQKDVEKLLDVIKSKLPNIDELAKSTAIITKVRYKEILQNIIRNLADFRLDKYLELSAESIRLSLHEIGKVTGDVDVEEVLDNVFLSFCIGK